MEKLEQRSGLYQVRKSKGILDAAIRTTSQDLLGVKLKNEQFQKQTYADEIVRQQIRTQQILDEAKISTQKNLGMEMNWEKLKEIDECEQLNGAIQEQIKMFNEIISGKESLIKEFWEELKKKDDQYIKMLKEQQIEIKDIIGGMRNQFYEIRDANLRELTQIEIQFEKEREQLINDNKSDINDLFSRHDKEESQYLQGFTENDNNNFEKIEELRIMGAKAYAKIKIEMEGEIQNLQKCLEDMNALYILNTEKLDYNLKVLKEKNDENKSLQEELKRKDGLLQNRLRILTNDYNSQKIEFRKRNKLLTQEYKRITLQFMELQKKFKHFEKADSVKYTEIQKMNEEEVRNYKSKIIQCDLTIHNQQLGKQRKDVTENEDQSQYNQNQQSPEKEQEVEENQLKFSEQRVREIVDIILDEGDFLIDDRMTSDLQNWTPSEGILNRMSTIKKCLGIDDSILEFNLFLERLISRCRVKSEEELIQEQNDRLLKEQQKLEQERLALEDDKDQKKNDKKPTQDEEQNKEDLNRQQDVDSDEEEVKKCEEKNIDLETVEINKNKVIEFLIKWVSKSDQRKQKLAEENNNKRQQKQESEREKKERIARKGKQYWENLTNVLPAKTFRIWNVLDKALSRYYKLLLSRQKIIDETGELHNQNEELKNLLNQYLQINHELQIPPTRLINLEQN